MVATPTSRKRETTRSVIRLGKMKAPYPRYTAVIRTKILQKGLFGCETAPANKSAMRTFRSEVVNAATHTTKRRSTELTSAVASNGSDIDPEVEVYVRRVHGFRRALVTDNGNKEMIEELLLEYRKNEEPRTMLRSDGNYETLGDKEVAGIQEPRTGAT